MSEEFYHDDPIESDVPKRKKSSALAALVLIAVGGFIFNPLLLPIFR